MSSEPLSREGRSLSERVLLDYTYALRNQPHLSREELAEGLERDVLPALAAASEEPRPRSDVTMPCQRIDPMTGGSCGMGPNSPTHGPDGKHAYEAVDRRNRDRRREDDIDPTRHPKRAGTPRSDAEHDRPVALFTDDDSLDDLIGDHLYDTHGIKSGGQPEHDAEHDRPDEDDDRPGAWFPHRRDEFYMGRWMRLAALPSPRSGDGPPFNPDTAHDDVAEEAERHAATEGADQ